MQLKVGLTHFTIEKYLFLLQMAPLFSLKQRQGQLVQTLSPPLDVGVTF